MKWVIFGLALVLLVGIASAQTPISECTEITESGYYYLTNNISSPYFDNCIIISANNVILDGNGYAVYNSWNGISIDYSTNVTITNLVLDSNQKGIDVWYSTNVKITNNTISNSNWAGIVIRFSNNIIIANNTISNNEYDGIYFSYSSNIIITDNIFINCGLNTYESFGNTVVNNTVNGKPLVYLENAENVVVTNAGQVVAVNSRNITVKDSDLSYTSVGVKFWNVSDSFIINNTISNNNDCGIDLRFSSNNTIANNTISNNNYGIYLSYSSNNLIYNNLLNNTNNFYIESSINTWNTTLKSGLNILGGNLLGGNAWFSPDGTGYSQTCSDTDNNGICDEPYVLDNYNIDYLPLSENQPLPTPTPTPPTFTPPPPRTTPPPRTPIVIPTPLISQSVNKEMGEYVKDVIKYSLGIDFSIALTFFMVLAGLLFFAGGIQTGAIGFAFMTMVNLILQIIFGFGLFIPMIAFLCSLVIWIIILVFSGEEKW